MQQFSHGTQECHLLHLINSVDRRNEEFLTGHEVSEARAKSIPDTTKVAAERITTVKLKKSGALNLWADEKALATVNVAKLDKEALSIARERAKEATDKIHGAAGASEKKLFGKGQDAKNSLAVLQWKVEVCREAQEALKKDMESRQKTREVVAGVIEKAKKVPKATAEELKRINLTMEHLQSVMEKAQAQVDTRRSREHVSIALRVRDGLRSQLLDYDPSLAPVIDKLILNYAAKTDTELLKRIEALTETSPLPVGSPQQKPISKEDKNLLTMLTKELRKNGKATAEVLKAQASASVGLNRDGEPVQDRLMRAYEQADVSRSVVLTVDGKKMTFGVLSKDPGDGGRIILIAPDGEKAAIDVANQKLTFHHGASFIHYDLSTRKLSATDDPTKIHLSGRMRARSVASNLALAA